MTAMLVDNIDLPLEKVAFGSCNDQFHDQPMWDQILAGKPQLWIWMGDTIYGDYRDFFSVETYIPPFHFFRDATPDMLSTKYRVQLSNTNYSKFRDNVPIIGIWDDHDYGRNDGDKRYPYREESQRLFLDFLGEPLNSQRRQQEGVYSSYLIGNGPQQVKFILLDVRYNKDSYDTGDDDDFLGDKQWAWLENELRNSTAAFNFIVSGIQVLPDDRIAGGESWGRFPKARLRLIDMLLHAKARGIMILSGDVHFAEMNQVICGGEMVTISEFTSSGLTHSWDSPRDIPHAPAILMSIVNRILPWEYRPDVNDYYGGMHYGDMTIDWDATPVPVATLRIVDSSGHEQLVHTVTSQRHDASVNGTLTCKPVRQVTATDLLIRRVVAVVVIAIVYSTILTAPLLIGYSIISRSFRRKPSCTK